MGCKMRGMLVGGRSLRDERLTCCPRKEYMSREDDMR